MDAAQWAAAFFVDVQQRMGESMLALRAQHQVARWFYMNV